MSDVPTSNVNGDPGTHATDVYNISVNIKIHIQHTTPSEGVVSYSGLLITSVLELFDEDLILKLIASVLSVFIYEGDVSIFVKPPPSAIPSTKLY